METPTSNFTLAEEAAAIKALAPKTPEGTVQKIGIAPGLKLSNGATILLSAGPGAGDYCVVLGQTATGEYVTWRVDTTTLDAFWGDYYGDDLPAACESFLARGFSYGTSRFDAAA